tara:strand:+ start:33 stop:230 length:198 start_codon:yes stop_codon:yes gene_type:complete
MSLFDVTQRKVIDLALTRGMGGIFSPETLTRMGKQNQQFLKPKFNNYALLSFIPLAIIAFLVLKK